jgi:hypothetical protein
MNLITSEMEMEGAIGNECKGTGYVIMLKGGF